MPSEERADMEHKLAEYFAAGVVQVWQVFPEEQQVIVFTAPTEQQTLETGDIVTAGNILPGFSYRVTDFFSWEQ